MTTETPETTQTSSIFDVPEPTVARIDDPETLMQMVCNAADEMKAHDVAVLDVRGQTVVADFFVICAGTSTTHIQAIAEGIVDDLRINARRRARPEGNAQSLWMVLDFGDVIVHIFDEGTREFYDLERLWADAKVSHWPAGESRNESPADDVESHSE